MSITSPAKAAPRQPKSTARSRASNAPARFLEPVDGRSREARRFRDVVQSFVVHLGGEDMTTEAQLQLVRRLATLVVWAEVQEVALASGAELDIGKYTTAVNTIRRLAVDLGLERKMRDTSMTIDSYLASKS